MNMIDAARSDPKGFSLQHGPRLLLLLTCSTYSLSPGFTLNLTSGIFRKYKTNRHDATNSLILQPPFHAHTVFFLHLVVEALSATHLHLPSEALSLVSTNLPYLLTASKVILQVSSASTSCPSPSPSSPHHQISELASLLTWTFPCQASYTNTIRWFAPPFLLSILLTMYIRSHGGSSASSSNTLLRILLHLSACIAYIAPFRYIVNSFWAYTIVYLAPFGLRPLLPSSLLASHVPSYLDLAATPPYIPLYNFIIWRLVVHHLVLHPSPLFPTILSLALLSYEYVAGLYSFTSTTTNTFTTAIKKIPRSVRWVPCIWGMRGGGGGGTAHLAYILISWFSLPILRLYGPEIIAMNVNTLLMPLCRIYPSILSLLLVSARRLNIASIPFVLLLSGLGYCIFRFSAVHSSIERAADVLMWITASPMEYATWKQTQRRRRAQRRNSDDATTTQSNSMSTLLPKMMDPVAVPRGASDLVTAILSATDHYTILSLPPSASDSDIRKAKRRLSLATHPDKNHNNEAPGAAEACARVLHTADVLLDPVARAAYDRDIESVQYVASTQYKEMADAFFEQTGIDMRNTRGVLVACTGCALGMHQLPPLLPPRSPLSARWCADCREYHPVSDGEFWVESVFALGSGFVPGRMLRMLFCSQGQVLDASEVGECEGMLDMWVERALPTNTHVNLLVAAAGEGGGGGTTPTNNKKKKKKKDRKNNK